MSNLISITRSRFLSGRKNLLHFVAGPVGCDFSYMLADRLIRLVVGLAIAGIVGRHLGTEALGLLNYAVALMAFGAALAQLGLDGVVVREIVKHPEEANAIVGSAVLMRTLVGLVLAATGWILAPFMTGGNDTQRTLIRILALSTLSPAMAVPMLWFQGRTKSRIAVCAALVGFFGGAALRVWLLIRGASVFAFAWASLVEMLSSGLLVFLALYRHGGRISFHSFRAYGVFLFVEGWPLMIGALAATLYMRIDQVMLKWMVGADAVGVYSAATRLSEAAYAVPILAGASMMATLTSVSHDAKRFDSLIDRYFQASAALGYLLTIPAIIVAPWLLRNLYGDAFSGAGAIAQIHLLSVIFVSISVARGRVLVINGLTRFAMFTALLGGVFNVILNLALIPQWGSAGAAIATVAAHAMAAVGSSFFYGPARSLGWKQVRSLLRPRFYLKDLP